MSIAEHPVPHPSPNRSVSSSQAPEHLGTPLVVIGAGDGAAAAYRVIRALDPSELRWRFTGFLDDSGAGTASPGDAPAGVIGGVRLLADLDPDTCFVLAAGTPATRRIVASWAAARGRVAVGVADPSAVFRPGTVGPGHVIGARTRISPTAVIATFAAIGSDVVVGEGASVGDFVTLGSGTHLGAGAVVEDEVILGRGVDVAPGVRIGARAVVHDGVVVTDDVPADARVVLAALQTV